MQVGPSTSPMVVQSDTCQTWALVLDQGSLEQTAYFPKMEAFHSKQSE